ARPITGDSQHEGWRPVAGDQSGACVYGARRLLNTIDRPDMKAEPTTESAVPAEAVEVDRVGLRGVDADVERDVLVLVDAGRRGVPLDLLVHIVADFCPHPA